MIYILLAKEKYWWFQEIAKPLYQTLLEMGYPVELKIKSVSELERDFIDDDLYILLTAEIYSTFPLHYIVYQFEQLPCKINTVPQALQDFFAKCKNAREIWDYSYFNLSCYPKSLQSKVKHIPMGYHSSMVFSDIKITSRSNKYDIIWYGNIALRRKIAVPILKQKLGSRLTIFANNLWNNDNPRMGPITHQKFKVLQRSKIVLNLRIYDNPKACLEIVRILYAMANGCLVISEYSGSLSIQKYLSSYVIFAHFHQIPEICNYYLTNEDKRKEKVEKGIKWLRERYKWEDILSGKIELNKDLI